MWASRNAGFTIDVTWYYEYINDSKCWYRTISYLQNGLGHSFSTWPSLTRQIRSSNTFLSHESCEALRCLCERVACADAVSRVLVDQPDHRAASRQAARRSSREFSIVTLCAAVGTTVFQKFTKVLCFFRACSKHGVTEKWWQGRGPRLQAFDLHWWPALLQPKNLSTC